MNIGQIIKLIAGILFFVIIIFILWQISTPFIFQEIFTQITDLIISETGINTWLARTISALFAGLLTYACFLAFSITEGRELKRNLGLALISIVVCAFCFFMYQITKGNFFKPDGPANQCYTRLIDGSIELTECNWKVHKLYGTVVMQVNQSIIAEYQNQNKPLLEVKPLRLTKKTRFFSNDGKPLYWYYQHANGKLEFFKHSGHHPQLNTILAPVNPEIVIQFLKYVKNGNTQMIIGNNNVISDLVKDMENWKLLHNIN